MDKDQFVKEFNKPENRKFDPLWTVEDDMLDSLQQAAKWYDSWSKDTARMEAKGDKGRTDICKSMVRIWNDRLVGLVEEVAQMKEEFAEAAKDDPLFAEFLARDLSLMPQVYKAFARLDEQQFKSGKAICDAIMPHTQPEPAKQEAVLNTSPRRGPSP